MTKQVLIDVAGRLRTRCTGFFTFGDVELDIDATPTLTNLLLYKIYGDEQLRHKRVRVTIEILSDDV